MIDEETPSVESTAGAASDSTVRLERTEFEKWVEEYEIDMERTDFSGGLALIAWNAATKVEREACANVCDKEHKRDDLTGDYRYGAGICAYRIRSRPNGEVQPDAACGGSAGT